MIIFDEAPMINKLCVHALDRTFKDITKNYKQPMGGITVILCGDFRQVPTTGGRTDRAEVRYHRG